jgi:hypothetical protein
MTALQEAFGSEVFKPVDKLPFCFTMAARLGLAVVVLVRWRQP